MNQGAPRRCYALLKKLLAEDYSLERRRGVSTASSPSPPSVSGVAAGVAEAGSEAFGVSGVAGAGVP